MSKTKARSSPAHKPPPLTTAQFWSGENGTEYTQRNRVDWEKRLPFWQHILETTNAQSFLEVGCNAAWNFRAIKSLNAEAMMTGVDLNEDALREANASGFDVEVMAGNKVAEFFGAGCCDLSLTSGVLIHVPPEELMQTMAAIRDVSRQYVLAVEYDNVDAQMVEYRGHKDKLWKRPYGKLYESLGLSLIQHGPAEGFDQCYFWLLEK